MSNNYAIIIQARTGSTRLPGKVLRKIHGTTVLEHVVRRTQVVNKVNMIIVATTVEKADLPIVKWCASNNVRVYCGSLLDVLDRYYQSARLFNARNIVRITSDCPLIDPKLIDQMIEFHQRQKTDYAANILETTFPDGEDIEICTFSALEKTWQEAKLGSEREHVTPYIRKHPELFTQASFTNRIDYSHMRWTLDEPQDLKFITSIYKELYRENPLFGMDAIIDLLQKKPQLSNSNSSITRNAGYLKSLQRDKKT